MKLLKYINLLVILISVSFAEILLVPQEYSYIQRGIDSASEGDTVLVSPGHYCENLIINKSITLASYALYDDLNNWLSNEDSTLAVSNELIINQDLELNIFFIILFKFKINIWKCNLKLHLSIGDISKI